MNVVVAAGLLITLVTGIPVLLQMLKNHPRGLIILFFAEMWERFSYYGMRALLIFYLTQFFLFDQKFSTGQYGSYGAMVYLLPLLGGFMADKYLGTRKAVAFGAVLLVAGHFTMAYEGTGPARESLTYAGQTYAVAADGRGDDRVASLVVNGEKYAFGPAEKGGIEIKGLPANAPLPTVLPEGSYKQSVERDQTTVNVFYLALSLIIMGVGFLKPNISTLVGQLYPQGDPRRDSGFTLYYYGINLGSFWAATLCGLLGQTVGWWAGFGLAGIGMAAGWLVFVLGKPLLLGHGEPPNPEKLARPLVGPINREWLIYIFSVLGVGGVWFLIQNHDAVTTGLTGMTFVALAYIGWFMIFKCDRVQRERMALALVLIFGAVVFFTLFEQAGSSLNLFAEQNVDLSLTAQAFAMGPVTFGTPAQMAAAGLSTDGLWIDTTISAAQTQSFNSGYILLFAPVFAAMWAFLASRKSDPNPVVKFGLGLAQVGLGFLIVVWGAQAGMVNEAFRVPIILLLGLYLFHTTGELFLSPVGLSEVTKLSVASVVSFMMATWFLASSIAHALGGYIAGLAGTETVGGQVLDPKAALETSLGVFNMLGWWGVGIGAAFILISFLIKGWSHGANDPQANPSHVTDRGQEI